jgi:N-acetylglucosamine kinase-like BadF-type ATPase
LDWPSDEERLRPVIERLGVGGPQVLVNDSFVALRAGAPWGIVIVAGTGTTCAGRNREGETARTLGLGWTFDDWGSAPEMAEACVRAVARAYTGHGPATSLTGRLAHVFDAPDSAGLLEGLSRGRYDLRAAVTQVIQALAGEASKGDKAAVEVSRRGGRELGERATTVIQRLGMEKDAPHVVLAGGLFRTHNPVLLEELEKTVRAVAAEARLVPLSTPPVVGAALLAMEATGMEVAAEVHNRLTEETRRMNPKHSGTAASDTSPHLSSG